jgi:hypothetical protein
MPIRSGDIYFADSVYGFTVIVYWDRSKLELDNIIGVGDNTIVRNRPSTIVVASKDPEQGILYIEVADTSLSLIAGQNKPLLYLSGNITDPDTVDGLNGWIMVNRITFESPKTFDPITYLPGFVHVVQDTTAAFTGRLSVSGAAFDTLRADTIELTAGNIAKRKVSEISFTMKASAGYYSFVDTLQAGTLGSLVNWSEKEVRITPDSISARFVAPGELQLQGPLLKVVLRRNTDSAFDQPVSITRFEINQESCLGRLTTENARITALAIPGDSTPSSGVEYRPTIMEQEVAVIPQVSNGAVVVQAENIDIQEVRVFDGLGRLVPLQSINHSGRGRILIQMPSGIASGVYFLELRSQHTIIYKQIRLIQ